MGFDQVTIKLLVIHCLTSCSYNEHYNKNTVIKILLNKNLIEAGIKENKYITTVK